MKKDRISEVYTEFENSYKGKSKEEMEKLALEIDNVKKFIDGKEIVKIITIQSKIVKIVVIEK